MPHSPPKLHRRAPPPRQWEEKFKPGLLLQTDSGEGENVQNDCVSVGALGRGSVV